MGANQVDADLGALIRSWRNKVKPDDSIELCVTAKGWLLEVWSVPECEIHDGLGKRFETPEEAIARLNE